MCPCLYHFWGFRNEIYNNRSCSKTVLKETDQREGALRDQLGHERERVAFLTAELEKRDALVAEAIRDCGVPALTARESSTDLRDLNPVNFVTRRWYRFPASKSYKQICI